MTQPANTYWGNGLLAEAVTNGSVSASRLDDMATRIIASWYRYAKFENPGITPNTAVDARKCHV